MTVVMTDHGVYEFVDFKLVDGLEIAAVRSAEDGVGDVGIGLCGDGLHDGLFGANDGLLVDVPVLTLY